MFIELNLSETQKSEILNVINKYQENRESTREKLRDAREALKSALQSEPFNEEAVRAAYRRVSSIQEDLRI